MEYQISYNDNAGNHITYHVKDGGEIFPERHRLAMKMGTQFYVLPIDQETLDRYAEYEKQLRENPPELTERDREEFKEWYDDEMRHSPAFRESMERHFSSEGMLFYNISDFRNREIAGNPRKWLNGKDCWMTFDGNSYQIHHVEEGVVLHGKDARIALAIVLGVKVDMGEDA